MNIRFTYARGRRKLSLHLEENVMSCQSASSTFQARPGFQQPFSVTSGFKRLAAALVREIRIRRALREVGALGEEALHDIGINPGGVENAVRYGRH